jgi:large subunit ribosomal protein L9
MQVILLEKLAKLGQLGDIVKVKDGYARNFLIPQGKAKRATEAALKEFEGRRAELEKAHSDRLWAAQSLGERMAGLTVQIPARAGVDGRLFGSVTNFDIAEAVGKQGFEITKAQVRMPQGPLKSVGDHKVSLALHSDVVVEITVSVLSDAV